jgi:hypothetical protein
MLTPLSSGKSSAKTGRVPEEPVETFDYCSSWKVPASAMIAIAQLNSDEREHDENERWTDDWNTGWPPARQ